MTNRQQQDAHHRAVVSAYYQDKDEAPLGEVLAQLRPRLLKMLRGPLGVREPAQAEDLAQQALILLIGALRRGKYAQQGTLAAYAASICRREWLASLHPQPSRPGLAEDPYLLLPASTATPADDIPGSELQQAAIEALAAATQAVLALDQPTRAAVVLHFYHGLAAPAAAAQLGIGEYAFNERLRRGVAALQAWGRTVARPPAEVYAALSRVDSGDLFREPLRLAG